MLSRILHLNLYASSFDKLSAKSKSFKIYRNKNAVLNRALLYKQIYFGPKQIWPYIIYALENQHLVPIRLLIVSQNHINTLYSRQYSYTCLIQFRFKLANIRCI